MIRVHLRHLGVLFFADQKFAAFETNTLQNFHNFLDVLNEKNGACHFNITKIARCLDVSEAVGWTNDSRPQHAHTRVEQTARHFFVVYVCIF